MDLIEIIILLTITISGTVFGSFFTLAVHRIPKKEDITHERSYCPKCNHKLHFLDLIPVFSYIFLGGKCRYCKEKIRPRYLILEIFSGLVFLLLALSYKINIETTVFEFISFILIILFFCFLFISAGIDKETYSIPNGLVIYGLAIAIIKNLYEYFVLGNSVYFNILGFLIVPIFLLIINLLLTKAFKIKEAPFGGGDIKLLAVVGLFCGFGLQVMSIEVSIVLTLIGKLIEKIMHKENDLIAWGFYLAISTVALIIVSPYIGTVIEWFNYMICI